MKELYLSNKYYGRQNESLDNFGKEKFTQPKGIFKYQLVYNFKDKVRQFKFPHINGYGFSNLRFKGDPKLIEQIKVEVGGTRFDTICPSITGDMTFNLFNDIILISTGEHHICVTADYSGEFELSVDCIELTNYEQINDHLQFVFRSTQYVGVDNVKVDNKGIWKCRMNFNHPVYKIRVFSKEPIDKPTLIFNGEDDNKLKLEKINDREWVYNFIKPLNFSMIDNSTLTFNNKEDIDENEINIFANFLHIGSLMKKHGMYGLSFVK